MLDQLATPVNTDDVSTVPGQESDSKDQTKPAPEADRAVKSTASADRQVEIRWLCQVKTFQAQIQEFWQDF